MDSNGRFSQESGFRSQASLNDEETSSEESWHEENIETEESENEEDNECESQEENDNRTHDDSDGNDRDNNSKNSSDGSDNIGDGRNSSNNDGNNNTNGWEDAVSKAIAIAEARTRGAMKEAARVLTLAFISAEDAFEKKDLIIDAIVQGLSQSDQMALRPGFVTSYRGSFWAIMTEEEKIKRTQRSVAQRKRSNYFSQLFWLAFKVDWGLKGKKGPKKTKEDNMLLPSATGWYVYVLELKDECYYIGKTRDVQRRTVEHFSLTNNGSEWTREHKPIRVLEVISVPKVCQPASFSKNLVTKQYMMRFGIESTRSGSYPCKYINKNVLAVLQKEIADAKEKCFYCGVSGHFADACPNRVDGVQNSDDTGK